jgi:hypothetical protein
MFEMRYLGKAKHMANVTEFTERYIASFVWEIKKWGSGKEIVVGGKRLHGGEASVRIIVEDKDLLIKVGEGFDWKTLGVGIVFMPIHPVSGVLAFFKSVGKYDNDENIAKAIDYYLSTKE